MSIEPIIAAGQGDVRDAPDGWTIRTAAGTLSAHVEHTAAIIAGQSEILTA